MKKILLTVAFAGIFVISAQAQITITRNDMPNIGDTIRTSFTVIPNGINYEQAGADIEWDFSNLLPGIQAIDTFVSINSLPLVYQLVFNPLVATIASPVSGFDLIPGINLSDIYQFFRETNNFFGNAGVAFTFEGIPVPLRYDQPDIYFRFPVTYLSTDSSESSFNLALPDIGYLETNRKRVNHVDAWGTVTTPYGTFPTIRVKSYLTTYDSIYIDSLQFGQGLNREFIEYKWLASNMGIPLIQIDEEGPLLTARYIDSVRLLTGVEHLAFSEPGFRLFPNPANDFVYAEFTLQQSEMLKIELYDLSGRLRSEPINQYFPTGTHTRIIHLGNLKSGVYIVKVSTSNRHIIRKLLVH